MLKELFPNSDPAYLLKKPADAEERISRALGVTKEELRRLEDEGRLDQELSLELYQLSTEAISALREDIESGEASPEVLARVSMEAARTGQKLAGRDIKRPITI